MAGRRYRYNAAAEAELEAAAEWYERQRTGLGADLIAKVESKLLEILEAPERWPLIAGTRRGLTARFPYAIVYREISAEEIEIVAIAHLKRRPGYWAGR